MMPLGNLLHCVTDGSSSQALGKVDSHGVCSASMQGGVPTCCLDNHVTNFPLLDMAGSRERSFRQSSPFLSLLSAMGFSL